MTRSPLPALALPVGLRPENRTDAHRQPFSLGPAGRDHKSGTLIDHTKQTFRHNDSHQRLTAIHGHVLREALA